MTSPLSSDTSTGEQATGARTCSYGASHLIFKILQTPKYNQLKIECLVSKKQSAITIKTKESDNQRSQKKKQHKNHTLR
jgi:hypothetical protein